MKVRKTEFSDGAGAHYNDDIQKSKKTAYFLAFEIIMCKFQKIPITGSGQTFYILKRLIGSKNHHFWQMRQFFEKIFFSETSLFSIVFHLHWTNMPYLAKNFWPCTFIFESTNPKMLTEQKSHVKTVLLKKITLPNLVIIPSQKVSPFLCSEKITIQLTIYLKVSRGPSRKISKLIFFWKTIEKWQYSRILTIIIKSFL